MPPRHVRMQHLLCHRRRRRLPLHLGSQFLVVRARSGLAVLLAPCLCLGPCSLAMSRGCSLLLARYVPVRIPCNRPVFNTRSHTVPRPRSLCHGAALCSLHDPVVPPPETSPTTTTYARNIYNETRRPSAQCIMKSGNFSTSLLDRQHRRVGFLPP